MPDSTVTVDTGRESYDITIGAGLLAEAGERLKKVLPPGGKICVVTDDNVAKLYLMPLMKAL